jgi:ribonuclease Z
MSIDVHSLDDDNTLSLVEVLSDPELTLQAIVLHQNLPVLNNNAPMTTDSCAKALDDVFCCDAADVDDDEPVAKREKVSEASLPPATPFQRSVISYIGTALVPAKFDPKKAIALGVPRGPLFGRLTKGETITLSNGKIINPADVMDIDALSPRFAVLDCPSQECFDQLIAHSAFSEDSLTYVPMSCCIHYTPQELFDTDHYQSFLHRFGPNCKHILVNRHAFCDAPPMYRSAHINHLKLNAVDPDIFPLYASSDSLSVQHKPMPSNCFRAENLLRFAMSPVKDIGFDRCDIPMPIDIEAEVSSVLQANSEYSDAMTALQSNLSASKMIAHPLDRFQRDNAPEIVFLGTGSAIPSKYRNVSSTFLRIDAETCILLDCGEGTLGQLRLQFGVDQQTRCLDDHVDTLSSSSSSATSPAESLSGLDQMLFQLSAIFISHMHADHHLGLQSILCARERLRHALKSKNDGNDTMQDMLVIGPSQLLPFLCDFQSSLAQPLRFHFIDNASIQVLPLVASVIFALC